MTRQRSTTSPSDEKKRFLQEGAEVYLEAANSISAFTELIKTECHSSLLTHLPSMARALGKRIARNLLKDHLDIGRDWARVGAKVDVGDMGALYVFVLWDCLESPVTSLNCSLWLKDRDLASCVYTAVTEAIPDHIGFDDAEVWLTKPILPSEFDQLTETLDAFVSRWATALEKVGPLTRLQPVELPLS